MTARGVTFLNLAAPPKTVMFRTCEEMQGEGGAEGGWSGTVGGMVGYCSEFQLKFQLDTAVNFS
jgi:hypothetical protein